MYDLVFSGLVQYGGGSTPSHRHHFWEIVHYMGSTGMAVIDGVEYTLVPGSLFVIPPGVEHHDLTDGDMSNLYLSITDLVHMERRVHPLNDTPEGDILAVMRQTMRVHQLKPPNWPSIADAAVALIEQYLVGSERKRERSGLVERLEYLLVSHASDKDTDIKGLLDSLPVSGCHIRKLFRDVTGMSPLAYLTELRLTNARQLLATTSLTIKDVAFSTGFKDQYYFSRLFHRKVGMYPSEWRRMNTRVVM